MGLPTIIFDSSIVINGAASTAIVPATNRGKDNPASARPVRAQSNETHPVCWYMAEVDVKATLSPVRFLEHLPLGVMRQIRGD